MLKKIIGLIKSRNCSKSNSETAKELISIEQQEMIALLNKECSYFSEFSQGVSAFQECCNAYDFKGAFTVISQLNRNPVFCGITGLQEYIGVFAEDINHMKEWFYHNGFIAIDDNTFWDATFSNKLSELADMAQKISIENKIKYLPTMEKVGYELAKKKYPQVVT